jgi:hypothetical protein
MRDPALRARIRELLSSGRLSRQLPSAAQRDPRGLVAAPSIRVGLQAGEHCVVCGEAQPMVTYTYPDGRVIRMHTACDNLWHEERARPCVAQ